MNVPRFARPDSIAQRQEAIRAKRCLLAMVSVFCMASLIGAQVPPPLDGTGTPARRAPAPLPAATPVAFSPKRLGDLPLPVQMLGSAIVGSRVYVFGGNTEPGGYLADVWSAPLSADFQVGQWRKEQPLTDRRHYIGNATQVINDHIYIVGGTSAAAANAAENETKQQQTVIYTTVRADGTLDPWKLSDPFPGLPRSNAATASTQGLLYVTGGANNRRPVADIAVAKIEADGKPTGWRVAGTLPRPLWFHGVAIQQERMFVWGGLTGSNQDSATAEAWSAGITANGDLTAWRAEQPLPTPVNSAANCGFNDRLIAVCGRNRGGSVSQNIILGQVQDGNILGWRTLSTDLETHLYHAIALDEAKGAVMILGGRKRTSAVNFLEGRILTEVRGFQMGGNTASQTPAASVIPMQTLENGATPPLGKSAIIYFSSPNSPSCTRFERNVLTLPAAHALLKNHTVYRVDASKDSRQSYRYGLFKIPSMVVINADGSAGKSAPGMRTIQDLEALLR